MKNNEEVIKEMQAVVEQMRLDDLEEDPSLETELFDCDCCGKCQSLAGSIQYGEYRLCNDCVFYAELGFELKKIKSVDELIQAMEDKKLEEMCDFIKSEQKQVNN